MAERFDLPLGDLSEATIEHFHQITKMAKGRFCRKIDPELEIKDVKQRLLVEGDVYLSSLRESDKQIYKEELSIECYQYLECEFPVE